MMSVQRLLKDTPRPGDAELQHENCLIGSPASRKFDFLAAALLVLLVLVFFGKTVFFGQPFSRICWLADWDSLYSAYWTGACGQCDPSIQELIVPYFFLVAKLWHSGSIPLWNPYAGLGMPLIGDIQSAVLSPVRVLYYLVPNMYTYHLTLVLEVAIAAVGTFALARALRLPIYASCIAAIAYAFCPCNLSYIERFSGASNALLPGILCLFVMVAERPSIRRAVLAGIGCAVLILSGHPEMSLFDITFATILSFSATLFIHKPSRRGFVERTGALLLAGLVSFCLSAPMLLPFIEFLRNCETYKYNIGGSTWVPWQGILYNLIQPGFGGASPFLGVVLPVVLPIYGLLLVRRHTVCCTLTLPMVLAFVITARLGPLDQLFSQKPFNSIITVYCLPILLVFLAVLGALALSEFILRPRDNKVVTATCVGLACVLVVPPLLHAAHTNLHTGDFDMTLPHMAVNMGIWARQMLLLSVLVLAYVSWRAGLRAPARLVSSLLIAMTFYSQASVARNSLPVQRAFDFPEVQPIPLLKTSCARVVALGDHLLKPNTAAVYGISDVRSHNVMFPSGYLEFMQRVGAKTDMFNQKFDEDCAQSKLLGLASVGWILSLNRLPDNKAYVLDKVTHPQRIYVYRRTDTLPRVYFVHDIATAASAADALRLMQSPLFDAHAQAVIENAPQNSVAAGTTSSLPDLVTPNLSDCNTQIADVVSARPGYVIFTTINYPGWKATLDGISTTKLKANYAFTAVQVPAGTHRVVLKYEPLSFGVGVVLALFCIGGVIWVFTR